MMTMQNANNASHVTISDTPFLSNGGKEAHHPQKRGNRLPGY